MSVPQNPYEAPSAPSPSPYGYPPAKNQTPLLLAIGPLATGAIGMMSCLPLVGCCMMPLPLVSIGLGAFALTQKPEQPPKIMAIVGIVLSGLTLVAWIAMFAITLASASLSHPAIPPPANP